MRTATKSLRNLTKGSGFSQTHRWEKDTKTHKEKGYRKTTTNGLQNNQIWKNKMYVCTNRQTDINIDR